jgi:hypothetical protein
MGRGAAARLPQAQALGGRGPGSGSSPRSRAAPSAQPPGTTPPRGSLAPCAWTPPQMSRRAARRPPRPAPPGTPSWCGTRPSSAGAAFLDAREVRVTREPTSARYARVVVRFDPLADSTVRRFQGDGRHRPARHQKSEGGGSMARRASGEPATSPTTACWFRSTTATGSSPFRRCREACPASCRDRRRSG